MDLRKFLSVIYNTLPVAAQGAADLERPAGETPPPPRRDVPCAGCAWQEFIVCAARLSFGVVRELLGFPLGCRRFFVGVGGRRPQRGTP